MSSIIAKNEILAAKRRADLIVYADGGGLAPRGSSFSTITYVGGSASPHYLAAAGVMTNKRIPLTAADDVIEAVDTGANETLTLTAHVFETGDGPVRFTTTGSLPGGLSAGVDYWLIKFDANKVSVATSLANAYAGTKIDLTSAGSGTNTLDVIPGSSQRGLDGYFTYEFTQGETNFDGSEISVLIEGTGFSRANGGGTYTTVGMAGSFTGFESIAFGSVTYGDLMRLFEGVLAGKVANFTTGTLVFRNTDDTKTRLTVTTDATGRLTVTIGDLTP